MSETFFAYNMHVDEMGSTLRFFLHQANLQPMGNGTGEFFRMLAEDFELEGLPRFDASSWRLRHFVTDYMLDERYDVWEDVWANQWDVEVILAEAIDVTIAPTRVVGTRAYDESQRTGPGIILPAPCWIIADFPTAESRAACSGELRPAREVTYLQGANRMIISLGEKDSDWFDAGQPGAQEIRAAVAGCGGSSTWRELG